jgi:hypothetical protein
LRSTGSRCRTWGGQAVKQVSSCAGDPMQSPTTRRHRQTRYIRVMPPRQARGYGGRHGRADTVSPKTGFSRGGSADVGGDAPRQEAVRFWASSSRYDARGREAVHGAGHMDIAEQHMDARRVALKNAQSGFSVFGFDHFEVGRTPHHHRRNVSPRGSSYLSHAKTVLRVRAQHPSATNQYPEAHDSRAWQRPAFP